MTDAEPDERTTGEDPREGRSPLDSLGTLAVADVEVADGFEHVEAYTLTGLLTMLCHGGPERSDVVLMCGGAMGGLLGPADGLYHDLGLALVAPGRRHDPRSGTAAPATSIAVCTTCSPPPTSPPDAAGGASS